MRTFKTLTAVVVIVFAACGGGDAGVLPTTTMTPLASEPLVEFEASWLCQVQRFAFTELSDIDSEKIVALESGGFSEADYAEFEARLEDDASLRTEVKDRFLAECASAEPVAGDVDA